MMRIAIHTPDKTGNRFPNYALMKISAWHKLHGDTVEWYEPILQNQYDRIYSSSIFPQKDRDPYLRDDAICGGTGYSITKKLPIEIEETEPDYTVYPQADYAIGFVTRGCIRNCPWCVVPEKEGLIRPYRTIEQIAREDTRKIILMDNNILASDFGLEQLTKVGKTKYRIDCNQGLDARLVTDEAAKILAGCKWIRFVRFSCDTQEMIEPIGNAVQRLRKAGYRGEIFVYCLVITIQDALIRVNFLREINCVPFAQPIRKGTEEPKKELRNFARWVNNKAIFYMTEWEDYDQRIGGKRYRDGKR